VKRAIVFIEEPTILYGKVYRWRVRRLPLWHWRSVRLNARDAWRAVVKWACRIVRRWQG